MRTFQKSENFAQILINFFENFFDRTKPSFLDMFSGKFGGLNIPRNFFLLVCSKFRGIFFVGVFKILRNFVERIKLLMFADYLFSQ